MVEVAALRDELRAFKVLPHGTNARISRSNTRLSMRSVATAAHAFKRVESSEYLSEATSQ
jgi:hypothetical protein